MFELQQSYLTHEEHQATLPSPKPMLRCHPSKYRQFIIHDINLLNQRKLQLSRQQPLETSRTSSLKELLVETIIPTQQPLEVLKTQVKTYRQQNEEYLKNNMSTVQQKIRNKFLKQRVDFADSPNPKLSLCVRRLAMKGSPERERVKRYNHDLEEYLIRKKISKKCNTLSYEPHPHSSEMEESLGEHAPTNPLQVGETGGGRKGESRMIIVSHLNPVQKGVKFKNILLETARKSMSKQEQAQHLLKRYVNNHFNRATRSYEKPYEKPGRPQQAREDLSSLKIKSAISPVTFIRSPLNFTLAKKELNRLRKESIGLPLLLEGEDKLKTQCNQSQLQQRINSKKIVRQIQYGKKQVVYSRKNLTPTREDRSVELLQEEKTLLL